MEKLLLTVVRENRRGKGLYVEPTERQVMQIWGQVDWFQSAFAPMKLVQSMIRVKTQHGARMLSGANAA